MISTIPIDEFKTDVRAREMIFGAIQSLWRWFHILLVSIELRHVGPSSPPVLRCLVENQSRYKPDSTYNSSGVDVTKPPVLSVFNVVWTPFGLWKEMQMLWLML